MTLRKEALFSLFLLLLFAWVVWEARGWALTARLFPWIIGFPVLLLTAVQLARDLRGKAVSKAEAGPSLAPSVVRRRTAVFFAWVFGFFLAIWFLGFPIAIPLFLFAYLMVASKEKWWFAAIFTVVMWGFFWLLFVRTLHMPFAEGQLLVWLSRLM